MADEQGLVIEVAEDIFDLASGIASKLDDGVSSFVLAGDRVIAVVDDATCYFARVVGLNKGVVLRSREGEAPSAFMKRLQEPGALNALMDGSFDGLVHDDGDTTELEFTEAQVKQLCELIKTGQDDRRPASYHGPDFRVMYTDTECWIIHRAKQGDRILVVFGKDNVPGLLNALEELGTTALRVLHGCRQIGSDLTELMGQHGAVGLVASVASHSTSVTAPTVASTTNA